MDLLWSASTTMRNPERTYSFLQTLSEIEGKVWDDETQLLFQILLIKYRFYKPTKEKLSKNQIYVLETLSYSMSISEARDIFNSKKYVDAPMRGRTSFDPLEKLGLASLEYDEKKKAKLIKITALGRQFLSNEIALEQVVFSNLLKFQYPNPLSNDRKAYNTKPFINTLKLINEVNKLCIERHEKAKGISKDEFGIFVLSIKSYDEVTKKAVDLLEYRYAMIKLNNEKEKQEYHTKFVESYLPTFKEPVKNTKEYTDNIIRYIRLTKYIYIRGGGYYIDLEPRRMLEINSLLENDTGASVSFTLEQYKSYISDINSYVLPFETFEKLSIIAKNILKEINNLELFLSINVTSIKLSSNIENLKSQIEQLRSKRTSLQNLKIKFDYQSTEKITEAINALSNIKKLGIKPSIALEKWSNIALNIINDATLIKPNSPLGDDNEPTFTAPAGVPDIECYYDGFGAICEVTMLTSREQWYNEGQPVMRHLRKFEDENSTIPNYCLFIAPSLHKDTLNTFWIAVKYEYEGKKQRIIPLTISQLIDILKIVKSTKSQGRLITKSDMLRLYNDCINISSINDSREWGSYVKDKINKWKKEIVA